MALVQALLSMIGAVISCVWSPCCMSTTPAYAPISTTSNHVQTTLHRHEVLKKRKKEGNNKKSHYLFLKFLLSFLIILDSTTIDITQC